MNKLFQPKQNGVALITALLIVSLATIMAVSLVSRQYMDIRRTGNIMESDKAYLQALTMETSAAHLLTFSRNQLQKKFDNKEEFEQAVLGFQRLLILLLRDIEEPESNAENLVASLLDWMDADEEERIGGAEDGVYEAKDPPYKAANRMLASISELKLVEGFNKKILYGIPKDEKDEDSKAIPGVLGYVTALPDIHSTINVNLISEPKIIQSLSGYIDDTMAEEVLASQPFEKIDDFINHDSFEALKASKKANWTQLKKDLKAARGILDVQSSYFVAKSTAALGKSVFLLNSLVYVATDGTKLEVISRAIGTDGI